MLELSYLNQFFLCLAFLWYVLVVWRGLKALCVYRKVNFHPEFNKYLAHSRRSVSKLSPMMYKECLIEQGIDPNAESPPEHKFKAQCASFCRADGDIIPRYMYLKLLLGIFLILPFRLLLLIAALCIWDIVIRCGLFISRCKIAVSLFPNIRHNLGSFLAYGGKFLLFCIGNVEAYSTVFSCNNVIYCIHNYLNSVEGLSDHTTQILSKFLLKNKQYQKSVPIGRFSTVTPRFLQLSDGCNLVANHVSLLDPLALYSILQTDFSPKHTLFHQPFSRTFFKLLDGIPIPRENPEARRDAARKIFDRQRAIFEGKHTTSFLIFPEGTTSNNLGTLPFKSGAFKLGAPINSLVLSWHNEHVHPGFELLSDEATMLLLMSSFYKLRLNIIALPKILNDEFFIEGQTTVKLHEYSSDITDETAQFSETVRLIIQAILYYDSKLGVIFGDYSEYCDSLQLKRDAFFYYLRSIAAKAVRREYKDSAGDVFQSIKKQN